MHTLCRRRKSTAERLGRSPGSEVQSVLCGCFTFPGSMAEWSFEAASSLTVAGPRRIHTGLPCYAPRGHPNKTCVIPRAQMARRIARCIALPRHSSSVVHGSGHVSMTWEVLASLPTATIRRRGRFVVADLLEPHRTITDLGQERRPVRAACGISSTIRVAKAPATTRAFTSSPDSARRRITTACATSSACRRPKPR